MTSTFEDIVDGVSTSVAVKAPCRVATTANITLSGTQTIDGVAVVANDRVLVKDQTDATENGIYKVASTSWSRAEDFDGTRDVVSGTLVFVRAGTTNADTFWRASSVDDPIVFETSEISFTASVNELAGLTTAEVEQLAKIGATVISATQWGYLGGMTAAGNAVTSAADAAAQRTTLGLGTAAVEDVGSATGDVVQLEDVGGSPGLPAVDGSQLTGITAGTPNFSANRNGTNQTGVSVSTSTKVQHNNEAFDSDGAYDPTTNFRFTPQTAGKYLVIAQVTFTGLSDGVLTNSKIFKNGSEHINANFFIGGAGASSVAAVAAVEMNGSTDYLEHYARHNDAASRDILGGTHVTFFQAFRISS